MKRVGFLLGLVLLGSPPCWADRSTSDYVTVTKSATVTLTSFQTDVTLWTPASGNRIHLQGCIFSANRAMTIELEVSDVDVIPPIQMPSGGVVTVGGADAPIYVGAVDGVLAYTISVNSGSASSLCWGWEGIN